MNKSEETDVLTFFIYVMVLFTIIVGAFAIWNYLGVKKQRRLAGREAQNLRKMVNIAVEEEFREWVSRAREGSKTSGTVSDFEQHFQNLADQRLPIGRYRVPLPLGLKGQNRSQQKEIEGGLETPYRLSIKGCKRLERLIKFLHMVEQWPGARIKKIPDLRFVESKQGDKSWDASVELSLYKFEG